MLRDGDNNRRYERQRRNNGGVLDTAQYLMGLGPMPPPRPQDIAVAHMNAALDGGAFEEPWNHNAPARWPPQAAPAQAEPVPAAPTPTPTPSQTRGHRQQHDVSSDPPPRKLDVHLPQGTATARKKDDPAVIKIISVNIDEMLPDDFLSRVHAVMGLEADKAKIGWKTCDEKKKAPYHSLETHEDVQQAFEAHVRMLDSKRREKAVYMEVVNLEKAPEPEKALPKVTEIASSPDAITAVKGKLKCATHPGDSKWCYIRLDKGHEGEHVSLGLLEVLLWARKITDGEAEPDCITLPNCLNLDGLTEKTRIRQEHSLRSKGGPTINNDFHIHIPTPDTYLQPRHVNRSPSGTPKMGGTKHPRNESEESDDDSDDVAPLPIVEVLQRWHAIMPAFNFPQHLEALVEHGICYAANIVYFDSQFYIEKVGMKAGAAGQFIRSAEKLLAVQVKERKRERKKVRVASKENHRDVNPTPTA